MYTYFRVSGDTVSLSYVTQLVLSMMRQFLCPLLHNLFWCLSGQSVSPYCDTPGKWQCLPEYTGTGICKIVKYRSALDAKYQV